MAYVSFLSPPDCPIDANADAQPDATHTHYFIRLADNNEERAAIRSQYPIKYTTSFSTEYFGLTGAGRLFWQALVNRHVSLLCPGHFTDLVDKAERGRDESIEQSSEFVWGNRFQGSAVNGHQRTASDSASVSRFAVERPCRLRPGFPGALS